MSSYSMALPLFGGASSAPREETPEDSRERTIRIIQNVALVSLIGGPAGAGALAGYYPETLAALGVSAVVWGPIMSGGANGLSAIYSWNFGEIKALRLQIRDLARTVVALQDEITTLKQRLGDEIV